VSEHKTGDGEDDELPCVMGSESDIETVSGDAREVRLGIHSIDKIKRTEKSNL